MHSDSNDIVNIAVPIQSASRLRLRWNGEASHKDYSLSAGGEGKNDRHVGSGSKAAFCFRGARNGRQKVGFSHGVGYEWADYPQLAEIQLKVAVSAKAD